MKFTKDDNILIPIIESVEKGKLLGKKKKWKLLMSLCFMR
jgi:hypothetical protein